MKGKFVTFEGGEGVGKTTQLRLVRQYLEEKGVDAIFLREPGGNDIS
ncbi:MAG: thymidylate kinase, partial [Clostridia bacterium]|nr:thymidylate kinase [Clostridia bacterium]